MNLAKSAGQLRYIRALESKKPIIVSTGPAGCGKTMLACHVALENIMTNKCSKIILTRPNVAVDENLGYLPGDLDQKMDPWMRPMLEFFENTLSRSRIEKVIEVAPLGFIRGRTFTDTFIIADEMQNSTRNQMKMVLTRLGENSRMVVTGDTEQSDLCPVTNGLFDLLVRIGNRDLVYINHVIMDHRDIQRHPAVNEVLDIYCD